MNHLSPNDWEAARLENGIGPPPIEPKPHPFADIGTCWSCGDPFWISYALLDWTDRYCKRCRHWTNRGCPSC